MRARLHFSRGRFVTACRALLAAWLFAVALPGCHRHPVGTHDVALDVTTRGTSASRLLARQIERRLRAGKLEADVDPTGAAAARIEVDGDALPEVMSLLRWSGISIHRIDSTAEPHPRDRTGLTERVERAGDGATVRYVVGSREAIRAVVADSARGGTPAGVDLLAQPLDDATSRTRAVRSVALGTIPAGSVDVDTVGGNVLRLRDRDGAVARALRDARAAVGDEAVAFVASGIVVDVAPLPPLDPVGPAVLRVGCGRGLRSFARAHLLRRLLESPGLPALQFTPARVLATRWPLAIASLALPLLLSLAWLTFVRRFDRARPEPWWLVLTTFALGALSTLPAGLIEHGLAWLTPYLDPSLMTLGGQTRAFPLALAAFVVTVGMVEEGAKLAGTWALASRRREFDEPIDGMVYGAASSLGFAAAENVIYFTDGRLQSGLVAVRALESVPMHLFFGAIWGYALGRRLVDGRVRVVRYWLVAAMVHGLFDTCLSIERTGPLASVETLVLASVFVVLLRRALRYGPLHEHERGRVGALPRALFPVGSYPRFLGYATLVHVLGVAIVVAGLAIETVHHRPNGVELVALGALIVLMGLAARRLADAVPLDVALDEAGVTFGGARRAWDAITDVALENRGNRAALLLRSPAGDVRVGPASVGTIARLHDEIGRRLAARAPKPGPS